ncbi:MAG: tRNA nucleotidyltransferase, partial [Schleiferiaceae bacterium]|nr:tRNA nucleotidyltransferase [Schleiferiaceae bacterium]
MSNYSHFLDRPIFKQIGQAADHLGLECYVVGGYVRDRLIERPTKMDLDFVTVGSGIALAKEVRKGFDKKPKLSVFKSFGTAH